LAGARKPAIRLEIDFGPKSASKSSAQITVHYRPEAGGRQVAAVVNSAASDRQDDVGSADVGLSGCKGGVVLIAPERAVPNGSGCSEPLQGYAK
jgi:tRNA-binding protein